MKTNTQRAMLGGVLLAGLLLVGRARGRETPLDGTPVQPGSVAMVDLNRVYLGAGFPAELTQKEYGLNAEARTRYEEVLALQPALLETSELQELLTLFGKTTRTDAENKRRDDLKSLAKSRSVEAQGLLAKPQDQLTPADRVQLDRITTRQRTFESQLAPSIEAEYLRQVRLKLDAFRDEQVSKIRIEVSKIARDKGIAQVFDRQALVYTGVDLTDETLQRLTRKPR